MKILTGKAIAEFIERSIDKQKQTNTFAFELTAKSITQLEGVGKVDFGGNEFEWGQRSILSPKRFLPNDEYGWWKLTHGEYIVRFNEAIKLPPNTMGYILPLDRIAQNGAHHAPLLIQSAMEHVEILFQVGQIGIELKENARISMVMVFET